jgi:hypothetical protein
MTTEKLIKRLLRLQGGCVHASEDAENWSMHDALVANARTIGIAIARIKTLTAENKKLHDHSMQSARCVLDGVKHIMRLEAENQQLRQRLVRQACYFEHIEAKQQPKGWPLLEDEGDI